MDVISPRGAPLKRDHTMNAASFYLSRDMNTTVSAGLLQQHFGLESKPRLVAEQPTSASRRKRIQVWDAGGVGICVRWDSKVIVAWMQTQRTDGPPWDGETFARENNIPTLQ